MPAYVIITKFRTRNADELQQYSSKRDEFMAGHELRFLASFTGAFEVAEGPGAESVAIIEFPTLAAAKAWYGSPEYQTASDHRHLGGDYGVMFVEGSPPSSVSL